MLQEMSGEITPERMKGWSQRKNNTQSCPTRSDPMDRSLPGSSIHGIFQAGVLEWSAIALGEFNSDVHYIYYCGQESLRRNGVAIMVNKRVQIAVLECNLKNDRMISVHFKGKPFNITVIQVYAPTSNAEEAEVEQFYQDLQDLLEVTPKKDVLFIIGDWIAKVGSQEILE